MNKTFLKKTKEILLQEKATLKEKTSQQEEIDTDGDEVDEIQARIIMQLQSQLNVRDLEKLSKIDDALKRIDEKTYGLCQDCGEEIPEKRLTANLYFLTCISCAEDREIEINRKRL